MIRRHPFFLGIFLLFIVVVAYAVSLSSQSLFSFGGKVGIITIKGEILNATPTLKLLESAKRNSAIKAVVVRIESPGGEVAASQELYTALQDIRTHKPVVASLGSIAASGGYYVACGADKIVANPGTLTGSISSAMFFHNFKGLMEKVGVKSGAITGGKYKDIGSPLREMTKEEAALLQGVIDDVAEQFIAVVIKNRKLNKTNVAAIADGRIFTGRQAMAMGLVDELGGIAESVKLAAKLADIKGDVQPVDFQQENINIFDYVFDGFSRGLSEKVKAFSPAGVYYLLKV